jgi:hypothetical protein
MVIRESAPIDRFLGRRGRSISRDAAVRGLGCTLTPSSRAGGEAVERGVEVLASRRNLAWPGLLVVALLPLSGRAQAQTAEAPPFPFLRKAVQLTNDQIESMDKGEVVTKQLKTDDKAEVAAFGVVKVKGTREALLQKLRDVENFRKTPQVPEIAKFAAAPGLEDIAGLTFDDPDLEALKSCKPGDCNVKIGAAGLDRLRKDVDWSAPEAKARATTLLKDLLLSYVKGYLLGGTDAMGLIVDKKSPKALSAEFRTLLKDSPYLPEYLPTFNEYLSAYPKGSLSGAEDFLFWSKDTYGLKPVVSIYHVTLYPRSAPVPGLLVAFKTLYSSHYFNAGLEVMVALDTPEAKTSPGIYLLDLYRARIDPPTGMLSGVLLGKVRSGVEQGVAGNLKHAKARVEGP